MNTADQWMVKYRAGHQPNPEEVIEIEQIHLCGGGYAFSIRFKNDWNVSIENADRDKLEHIRANLVIYCRLEHLENDSSQKQTTDA